MIHGGKQCAGMKYTNRIEMRSGMRGRCHDVVLLGGKVVPQPGKGIIKQGERFDQSGYNNTIACTGLTPVTVWLMTMSTYHVYGLTKPQVKGQVKGRE
jgi:hypothetical protein